MNIVLVSSPSNVWKTLNKSTELRKMPKINQDCPRYPELSLKSVEIGKIQKVKVGS